MKLSESNRAPSCILFVRGGRWVRRKSHAMKSRETRLVDIEAKASKGMTHPFDSTKKKGSNGCTFGATWREDRAN